MLPGGLRDWLLIHMRNKPKDLSGFNICFLRPTGNQKDMSGTNSGKRTFKWPRLPSPRRLCVGGEKGRGEARSRGTWPRGAGELAAAY